MKNLFLALLFFPFLNCFVANGQDVAIDKTKFFTDTSIINATITANMAHVFRKKEGSQYPANFSATLPVASSVSEPVLLEIRGHFRKDFCYVPPLKILFKSKKTSVLKPLGSLKLVSQCKLSNADDQYLLKEFLAYKIYNLLTDMSFRVRLLNLNLVDSAGKKKTITEHAFLMEDIKDVAARNSCTDVKTGKARVNTEATDRRQMTIVAVFEYMIGNTDWAVPVSHNTRLIMSTIDSLRRPYVVPYDFDYSGFVNTDYAVPDENLNIPNVRERVYRGFPRTMAELDDVLDIFKKQKNNIYGLIKNFDLLSSANKKDMYEYLDEFFDLISNSKQINDVFIQQARTE